jgi:hypothetical protein
MKKIFLVFVLALLLTPAAYAFEGDEELVVAKMLDNLQTAVTRGISVKDAIRSYPSLYTKDNILEFIKSVKDTMYITTARDHLSKARSIIDNVSYLNDKEIGELTQEANAVEIELSWRPTRSFLRQVSKRGLCYIENDVFKSSGPVNQSEIQKALYATVSLNNFLTRDFHAGKWATLTNSSAVVILGTPEYDFEDGALIQAEKFGDNFIKSDLTEIRVLLLCNNTTIPYVREVVLIEDLCRIKSSFKGSLFGSGSTELTIADIELYSLDNIAKTKNALNILEKSGEAIVR